MKTKDKQIKRKIEEKNLKFKLKLFVILSLGIPLIFFWFFPIIGLILLVIGTITNFIMLKKVGLI